MKQKYKLGLYNLPEEYLVILKECFNDIFDIKELTDLNIIEKMDIVLININEKKTNDLKEYCNKASATIIRITDKPIIAIANKDIVLSINKNKMNKGFNESKMTYLEYTNKFIIKLIKSKYMKNKASKENIFTKQQKDVLGCLIKLNYVTGLKDEYLIKHSKNVSNYALLLGKELNLTEKQLEILEIGGQLHDIGKLGIPESILMKNSSLTDYEFKIIKKHPTIGEALLPLNGYDEIKQIIRNHHERIDGRGYPDGLKGSEIPLLSL